jgi:uncharacterized protein (TIGR03382 family)
MSTNLRTCCSKWALAAFAAIAIPAGIRADLAPGTATFTLAPGGTATETKVVTLPAKPTLADIEIAIDTTGSMSTTIARAKADAIAIVTGVQADIPDTAFAVVQFKDSFDSPEYQVAQGMTTSASAVQSAINAFSAGGGGDYPEAYNLVFQNSYTPAVGGDLGWRDGSRKFVIVLGDAPPHNGGAFAGCAADTVDPHGLVTATVIAGMKDNNRTLFMINEGGVFTCYDSLSKATGGKAINAGGSLAADIVALVKAGTSTVADVHLEVASSTPAGLQSWIALPPALGPLTPPATATFGPLTVSVPVGTPAGTYTFDIRALADGADVGHQSLTIVVPGTDGAPACAVPTAIIPGPPKQVQATVQDTGSGIKSIEPVTLTNATISIPDFTVGTTDPIIVTFTKVDQSAPSRFLIRITDVGGNSTECDPIVAGEIPAVEPGGCSHGATSGLSLLGLGLAVLLRRRRSR